MTPLPSGFLRAPFAHRGLHAAQTPENSRAAIRAAVEAGYGIELDLQPSRDGQAMVFHDDDLGRLTGARGPIRGRPAADLAGLRLAGTGEGIPTLPAILDLVAGRAPLLLELKDQHGQMGETCGTLEAATAAALAGYAGPVAVMSFNPRMMIAMTALAPGLARGLTTCAFAADDWPQLRETARADLRAIAEFDAAGAAFVSHQHHDLATPRLAELRAAGAAILCWTVRTPAEEAAARRVADEITFEGYLPAIPA